MAKLFVALDTATGAEAMAVVERLSTIVDGFKVGLELFSAEGPEFVRRLTNAGLEVFLDLKLHDIPATVAGSIKRLATLGVRYTNVHISGGIEMLKAAVEAARERGDIGLLGVTLLTSLGDEEIQKMWNTSESVSSIVVRMALRAQEYQLDGVIASPLEAHEIRNACRTPFKIVTPGIRAASSRHDDQVRTATPKEAVRAGADILIVGRPILKAPNMVAAARTFVSDARTASR